MRSLKLTDTFTVARILKKMHIRPEIEKGTTQETIGAQLFLSFFEGLGDAEEEVLAFIADLKGITVEELKEKEFEEMGKIIDEFSQLKGLKAFFTQVGKLMR